MGARSSHDPGEDACAAPPPTARPASDGAHDHTQCHWLCTASASVEEEELFFWDSVVSSIDRATSASRANVAVRAFV